MTQGLLNSLFHDKASGDRRRDLDQFRAQLADAVFSDVGRVAGEALQAADLPMLSRSAGGALEQMVRFRLRAAPAVKSLAGSLWLSAGSAGAAGAAGASASGTTAAGASAAGATAADGPGRQGRSVFAEHEGYLVAELSVPEVTAPEPLDFAVGHQGSPPVWQGRVVVRPQRKWSISLVHHTHLDVGYTDRQEVVLANHLQYLDSVLDLVEKTSSWEDDSRFRWNVEVNWPLERWFACRGPQDHARMAEAVRQGSVSVSAMSLNMHTEACAIEELYEMVRYAVELGREHGVPISTAMQTDVPGGVSGLVEVLADVGVNFLSVAHNYAGRSVPYLIGGEKLGRPFYWKAPSGKRVLVWHTDTLHGNAYMEGNIIGLADSYEVAEKSLPHYLAALARRPYPFGSGTWLPEAERVERDPYPHDILHLRVQGKYGDNAPPNIAVAEIAREWNKRWAYPHLRLDRNEEFAVLATERLAGAIEEHQGDWADWWADGLGSGARMLGWARHAQGSMRTGRSLHAVADVVSGRPPEAVGGTREAYEDIGLFDEHTWGARHPWEDDEEGWGSGDLQWQRKASYARDAREAASVLVDVGARRLAELAGSGRGLAGVLVFNATARPRTDVARVFLPFSVVPAGTEVVAEDDRTGAKVATVTTPQEHVEHRPLGRFVSFLAREVPGLGYARFNVVEGQPAPVEVTGPGAGVSGDHTVENEYYRLSYAGAEAWATSLVDLSRGAELVNTHALLGLNAYLFDRYGTSTKVDHLSGRVFSRALDLVADRAAAEHAVVLRRETSDLGQSIVLDVRAPGCSRLLTTVTAWQGVGRVDIHNRIWKDRTTSKQSVFFAFPFAYAGGDLAYELPGIGTRANAQVVPGSPTHMRALRHWVALAGADVTTAWATVDAPLVQFG
ncbi:MAG TPA: hypothetical protein VL984_04935, partial [Acidimicrobiales bacterium]|nr:hypothetical protein [Acidimicrobiales bacterium]